MARRYGPNRQALASYEGENLGLRLASIAVNTDVPIAYIAWVLGVTKMCIHNWFKGKNIHKDFHEPVEKLIERLKFDLSEGILPCKTLKEARVYVGVVAGKAYPSKVEKAAG